MYFFDGFYFLRLFYAINSLLKDSLHESDVCSLFINQLQGAKFFLALAEVRVLPISFGVRWWGFNVRIDRFSKQGIFWGHKIFFQKYLCQ